MSKMGAEVGKILIKVRGNESQSKLAEKWGIAQNSISKYEKGAQIPNADIFDKILELENFANYAEFFAFGQDSPAAPISDREKELLRVLHQHGLTDPEELKLICELISALRNLKKPA